MTLSGAIVRADQFLGLAEIHLGRNVRVAILILQGVRVAASDMDSDNGYRGEGRISFHLLLPQLFDTIVDKALVIAVELEERLITRSCQPHQVSEVVVGACGPVILSHQRRKDVLERCSSDD